MASGGAKFYYSGTESLGENAAKIPSSSSYTTVSSTFTINTYFSDNTSNYYYITPKTNTTYGGWANWSWYKIAEAKFMVKAGTSYSAYTFVQDKSAPQLQLTSNPIPSMPFGFMTYNSETVKGSGPYYAAKIYYTGSRTNIYFYNNTSLSGSGYLAGYTDAYGLFVYLAGGGGGGGGGDGQQWFQGAPGGGGGGGGAAAWVYLDAKRLYAYMGSGAYIKIVAGAGGTAGKGSAGFTDGGDGESTRICVCNSSGTEIYTITAGGGKGGKGHAWNVADDSPGGDGGTVTTTGPSSGYSDADKILKLLTSVQGGAGGAGRRGSDGAAGNPTQDTALSMPFTQTVSTLTTKYIGGERYDVGYGGLNHNVAGGAGGSALASAVGGYADVLTGYGGGSRGGGDNESGLAGLDGCAYVCTSYVITSSMAKTV